MRIGSSFPVLTEAISIEQGIRETTNRECNPGNPGPRRSVAPSLHHHVPEDNPLNYYLKWEGILGLEDPSSSLRFTTGLKVVLNRVSRSTWHSTKRSHWSPESRINTSICFKLTSASMFWVLWGICFGLFGFFKITMGCALLTYLTSQKYDGHIQRCRTLISFSPLPFRQLKTQRIQKPLVWDRPAGNHITDTYFRVNSLQARPLACCAQDSSNAFDTATLTAPHRIPVWNWHLASVGGWTAVVQCVF